MNLMNILINDKNYYKKRKDICPFLFLLPYDKKGQQKGAFYIRSFVKIIKLRHLKKSI